MSDSPGLDVLSPLAHRLIKLGGEAAYQAPVVRGPGQSEAREALSMVKAQDLLGVPVRQPDEAMAMLAGLWLWQDWLDESHVISQSLDNPSGSFWHAIMHRREGDFSNSKYWYRRVGSHVVFDAIAANVGAILNPLPADKSLLRLVRGGWNPDALVDLAEELDRRPDARLAAFVAVQKLEWRMLFDHCARWAVQP
jgi:hypothetical protein